MMDRRFFIGSFACLYAASRTSWAAEAGPSTRVVCVSKQINEFLFAIGAEKALIGRDLTSVYPPAILKLPSVGYHRGLSAEGILSLRPDLVLTDGNVGPADVLDQIRQVGISIMTLKPGEGADGARDLMRELGKVFHREPQAEAVIDRWSRDMEAVLKTSPPAGPRPRVLILHFGQVGNTYLAVGRNGVAGQVLDWAAADNAVDNVGGMTRLTPELTAQAAPDIILATDVGFDRLGSAEKFNELPGIALTPAGRTGRIFRIDETDVMYYGPRTPEAIRRIRALVHK